MEPRLLLLPYLRLPHYGMPRPQQQLPEPRHLLPNEEGISEVPNGGV